MDKYFFTTHSIQSVTGQRLLHAHEKTSGRTPIEVFRKLLYEARTNWVEAMSNDTTV